MGYLRLRLFGLEAERVGDFIKVVFDSAIDPGRLARG